MKTHVEVQSTFKTYFAEVGSGIFESSLDQVLSGLFSDTLFIFVDENVYKLHKPLIETFFDNNGFKAHLQIVPEGESSKSIEFWKDSLDFLLQNGVRRNTPLIAIGGGVTGDVAGFVAATAMRGIPLIHVPTTVLAMVDSSIGGKTSINHHSGKNLIGSFYQPARVIADINFLETLPRKEWINGLSEILKYGAIQDEEIFDEATIFSKNNPLETEKDNLVRLIAKCIQIKSDIVRKDEFESGIRAFLNYGHTFAHALEKACGFKKISHGEAVFLGMLAAEELSKLNGYTLKGRKLQEFRPLYSYDVSKDELSYKDLILYMKSDKKRTDSDIAFVLLKNWQKPVVEKIKNEQHIKKAWNVVFNELS